jgi:hemoglobin-like flavoprotein
MPSPMTTHDAAASSTAPLLDPAQVAAVRTSFAAVVPIAHRAGIMLFDRIFELAPETRPMFADDIAPQAARTIEAVRTLVDHLDEPDRVTALLTELGARHARCGVQAGHFPVVGAALLWTLEQGLGDAFSAEVRDAWGALWTVVAAAMLAGLAAAAA